MTAAGDLRFRVRFEKQVEKDSQYGKTTTSWIEQFSRAAAITPMRGGETVMGQRLIGTQPTTIVVRYDSLTKTIAADWRAVEILNGDLIRYYAIKAPPEDMERNRMFITIVAVSGEADGGSA